MCRLLWKHLLAASGFLLSTAFIHRPALAEPPAGNIVAAPAGQKVVVYDVSDLLFVPSSASVGSMLTEDATSGADFGETNRLNPHFGAAARPEQDAETRQQRLAAVLSAQLSDKASIRPFQTGASYTLFVSATPADHEKVAKLLQVTRKLQARQVSVECRVLTVSDALLAKLPEALQEKIVGVQLVDWLHATISTADRDAILREMQKDATATLAAPPRLTLFQGQASKIMMGEYQFFVTDHKPDAKTGELKPEATSVFSGLKWALRPMPSVDGKVVGMSMAFSKTNLLGVKNLPWKGDPTGEKVVQIPEVERQAWEGEVMVPTEGAVVLWVGPGEKQSGARLLVIQATVIEMGAGR